MSTELGIRTRVNLPYPEARSKTIEALKKEGFGVLTEIDVQATLKQKLNVDFCRYTILGACNPPLAHRALSAHLDIGLMLPCNVTVYEEAEGGGVVITAVSPLAMLGIVQHPDMVEVAKEAENRLQRVIASLNADPSGSVTDP